ncbi:MAG TPA: ABC transporter ATP-binding protein [Aliidongia sp.]|nr:ABC transporter ATP-binding protein [Aliidongia sp.]
MNKDLDVSGVVKSFGGSAAVDDVSFHVPEGSFFSILGPSGCGKTTLMRMIAGFIEPDVGSIAVAGRSILGLPPNRRPVNMVFQNLALFPMMNVAENIAYGLKCRGETGGAIAPWVERILGRVGLAGFGDRRVDQLSGGQKQRVAIARCLVLEPALVLLDEPLGALDLKLREHMKIELKQLQAEFGTTFAYITHDQSEALVMSDQVAVMARARFEQVGTPRDLYYRPATPFVAGFVGQSVRWSGRVEQRSGGWVLLRTAEGLPIVAAWDGAGADAELFVRPEATQLARTEAELGPLENRFQGSLTSLLFDGAASSVLIEEQSTKVEVRVALPQSGPMQRLAPGDTVWFGWAGEAGACFAVGP